MGDRIKLIVAILIVAAGLGAFYYYSEEYALLYRVLGLLAMVGLAVVVTLQTENGRAASAFFKEARTEVRKVVWPTRKESSQTTLLILATVVVVGVLLWLLDMGLLAGVKMLTGQGS